MDRLGDGEAGRSRAAGKGSTDGVSGGDGARRLAGSEERGEEGITAERHDASAMALDGGDGRPKSPVHDGGDLLGALAPLGLEALSERREAGDVRKQQGSLGAARDGQANVVFVREGGEEMGRKESVEWPCPCAPRVRHVPPAFYAPALTGVGCTGPSAPAHPRPQPTVTSPSPRP